jgi:flagellar motor switch protein FliG
MAAITDKNRSVLKEAAATLLDNFTQEELEQIAATASELQTILTAAKKRDQEKFRKVRSKADVSRNNKDARTCCTELLLWRCRDETLECMAIQDGDEL